MCRDGFVEKNTLQLESSRSRYLAAFLYLAHLRRCAVAIRSLPCSLKPCRTGLPASRALACCRRAILESIAVINSSVLIAFFLSVSFTLFRWMRQIRSGLLPPRSDSAFVKMAGVNEIAHKNRPEIGMISGHGWSARLPTLLEVVAEAKLHAAG